MVQGESSPAFDIVSVSVQVANFGSKQGLSNFETADLSDVSGISKE